VGGAAPNGPAGLEGAALAPQASDEAAPMFEAASVKANTGDDPRALSQVRPGGRLVVVNNTLRVLVRSAYGLHDSQIVGGPSWIDRDRFDIDATAGRDVPPDQVMPMLRSLLATRFKLQSHRERREIPVYRLVMARSDRRPGESLKPGSPEACAAGPVAQGPGAPVPCGTIRFGPGQLIGRSVSIDHFANSLTGLVQESRPITNQTELAGTFDVDLKFAMAGRRGGGAAAAPAPAPNPDLPSIFTALEEQLGLRLEPSRGPMDVLVIDRAEPPSAN
jgi:uncharacterized protein (TIGR03435 family)